MGLALSHQLHNTRVDDDSGRGFASNISHPALQRRLREEAEARRQVDLLEQDRLRYLPPRDTVVGQSERDKAAYNEWVILYYNSSDARRREIGYLGPFEAWFGPVPGEWDSIGHQLYVRDHLRRVGLRRLVTDAQRVAEETGHLYGHVGIPFTQLTDENLSDAFYRWLLVKNVGGGTYPSLIPFLQWLLQSTDNGAIFGVDGHLVHTALLVTRTGLYTTTHWRSVGLGYNEVELALSMWLLDFNVVLEHQSFRDWMLNQRFDSFRWIRTQNQRFTPAFIDQYDHIWDDGEVWDDEDIENDDDQWGGAQMMRMGG